MGDEWTINGGAPLFIAIDASGSMNRRDYDGRSRIGVALEKVRALLEQAPAEQPVTLMSFGAQVYPLSAGAPHAALGALETLRATEAHTNAGRVLEFCLMALTLGGEVQRGELLLFVDGPPTDSMRWEAWKLQNNARGARLMVSVLTLGSDVAASDYVDLVDHERATELLAVRLSCAQPAARQPTMQPPPSDAPDAARAPTLPLPPPQSAPMPRAALNAAAANKANRIGRTRGER